MTHLVRRWPTALRAFAIALIVAVIPLPALAQQTSQAAAKPRLQASIAPIVHTVAVATAKTATPKRGQSAQQLGSTSFFRTGPGIAVIAILAAGAGFAIYSASHDRIHSTIPASLQ